MKGQVNTIVIAVAVIALLIGGIVGYYASSQNAKPTTTPTASETFKPSETIIKEQFRYLEDLVEANTGQRPNFELSKAYYDKDKGLIVAEATEKTTSQQVKAYFTKDYSFIGFNAPVNLKSLVAQAKQQTQPQPTETGEVSPDDDPFLGEDNAPVTIIEFSDYQCPFCKKFYDETEKQLIKDYVETGKVKFVYRDFPLDSIHPLARKAAEAAECADEQGKFWEYHDKLFETQKLDEASLKQHAKDLGLDTEQFNSCLDSGKYKDEVQKDLDDGIKAGVTGTPTFFINGKKVVGAQPYSVIKQIIDDELSKNQ